jgi:3-oxoacyl-[acyl-carrier-protein] synthase-3
LSDIRLGIMSVKNSMSGHATRSWRRPTQGSTSSAGDNQLHMKDKPVFEFALGALVESIDLTMARASINLADVKWFVPHQANLRIIETVGEKLHLEPERVVLNIDRIGNTGAASIAIALSKAAADGRSERGDLVLSRVGAGMTWATALIRW